MSKAVDAWGDRRLEARLAEDRLSVACEKGPTEDAALLAIREAFRAVEREYDEVVRKDREEVRALGGLHVIGTEVRGGAGVGEGVRGGAGGGKDREGVMGCVGMLGSNVDDIASAMLRARVPPHRQPPTSLLTHLTPSPSPSPSTSQRHESRRIDNQLRGRGGRQGDPGSTRFFLSLEDNLFRVFGGNKIQSVMEMFRVEDLPIESGMLTKSLDEAQRKVEAYFFDIRKNLFEYDQVVNTQRAKVYAERRLALEAPSLEGKASRGMGRVWVLGGGEGEWGGWGVWGCLMFDEASGKEMRDGRDEAYKVVC